MAEGLETVLDINRTKHSLKSKVGWVLLATGLALSYISCEGTPEECCDCLRENGCTSVSKSSCEDKLNDGKTPPITSTSCVKDNCYMPCGDYFK